MPLEIACIPTSEHFTGRVKNCALNQNSFLVIGRKTHKKQKRLTRKNKSHINLPVILI